MFMATQGVSAPTISRPAESAESLSASNISRYWSAIGGGDFRNTADVQEYLLADMSRRRTEGF